MSEKRFVYGVIKGSRQAHIKDCHNCKSATIDVYDDNIKYFVDLLNEQQATISQLQDLCGESDSENARLRIENKKLKTKLKEKEEDERLYANEILELRKTNEEWLEFKELGGDY